ncbi:methyl-accepting chemotaxis protein [Aquabacterium sp.]|uniref:methyl-accepting chemotaxis protein n=1 Tax=Aquabacterium sp. TaxID=1872578 RepID=UPI0026256B9C|nr:methyl-accepting chemotaxis protein [Aquabacterium sp.]MDD2976187.1 methyl-accepting chemotaxis protein [Aquabacterium sp.]
MRVNLPVTQREFPFPPGQTLVSTTDPKGIITYCNESFIAVSGFQRNELLGQDHNIVRHPDMPEEAFRDMWATIQSGNPWTGPVKNRRKNGDHYWVVANAIPLMEDGHIVGYMSVRTEATREQIERAESLYASMRQEKQSGKLITKLDGGFVETDTLWGAMTSRARHARLSTKLLLASLINIGLGAVVGAWASAYDQYLLGTLAVGLIIIFAWQLKTRLVAKPLAELIDVSHGIAGGDLTRTVKHDRYDEIGDLQAALGQMSINLQSIVRDARSQSNRVVMSAAEIANANRNLSERTESQASNLEQTAASMEQITGTVRNSAESAKQAGTSTAEVLRASEMTNEAVQEVSQAMQGIHGASTRINDITGVIDGIAFQTNILALNAAIEAARAGEAGRGFSVVAQEVRALANRSADAAKEIKNLITDTTRQIQEGLERTQHASEAMVGAVEGVRKVDALVTQISGSAREQMLGISQVNDAVSHMDGITQQNTALVEEITASAHELEALARASRETMQVFRVDRTARRIT